MLWDPRSRWHYRAAPGWVQAVPPSFRDTRWSLTVLDAPPPHPWPWQCAGPAMLSSTAVCKALSCQELQEESRPLSSCPCTLSARRLGEAQQKVMSIQETVTETICWSAAQSMFQSKASISCCGKQKSKASVFICIQLRRETRAPHPQPCSELSPIAARKAVQSHG